MFRTFPLSLALLFVTVVPVIVGPAAADGPAGEGHPQVLILDGEGAPLEGVLVTITVDGRSRRSETNGTGIAVFLSLRGDTFPNGSSFTAWKRGYEEVSWEQGEPVPRMEVPDQTDIWIVAATLLMTAGAIALFATLAFRKGTGRNPE